MPPKKKAEKRHRVDGRTFVWTAEDGTEVKIPLRVEVDTLRSMGDRDLDVTGMYDLLEVVAPDQTSKFGKMDVGTEFRPMFEAWQAAYNDLSGATPGE